MARDLPMVSARYSGFTFDLADFAASLLLRFGRCSNLWRVVGRSSLLVDKIAIEDC